MQNFNKNNCDNLLEKNEIFKMLKERDLLYDFSKIINFNTIYMGIDGTASSLQIGNLIPLAAVKQCSTLGVIPIVLLGGATTKIGDPSGKNTTRKQIETDIINVNLINIQTQIKKLIPNAIIVNNSDWLDKLSFMDFLEVVAKFIPVSKIIKLKTFAQRLENNEPFSMKELLYPLLQGYDFLHLFENNNCTAQIGGQDQWCNLLTGIDLIQSKHGKETNVCALTCPLLVDKNGQKLGKSLNNAIYLSKEKTTIFDFWNFWRNIDDSIVESCLKKFSNIQIEQIKEMIKDINKAKIELANQITSWVHSKEEAQEACNLAQNIFINKNLNNLDQLNEISIKTNKLSEIVAQLKNISNTESKTLIKNNAVKLNNETINDISYEINTGNHIIQISKNIFKVKL